MSYLAPDQEPGDVAVERAVRADTLAEVGPDPDAAILAAVAQGHSEAFGALVERHHQRLFHLCERLLGETEDARDAVQEVFFKAFRKAGSYQPEGRVYTWLYRIAVNHCLNSLRRRRVVQFLGLAEVGVSSGEEGPTFDPPDPTPGAAAQLEARQRWQKTQRLIARLPPGQRTVLILAKFEELSYHRIAEVMGISESAVESRLFRAMRRLTQEVAD